MEVLGWRPGDLGEPEMVPPTPKMDKGIMGDHHGQTEKQLRFAERPEPKPELAAKESEL